MKSSNVPIVAIIALIMGALCSGRAADWYVRSGATGASSGVDWNNAWPNVTSINWTSVSAGDSIWIAGGNYGKLTVGKSGTPGNPIYIARVRETNSTPVAASGWNASFDSAVTLNTVNSYGFSYWSLDGQIPHSGIIVTNTSVSVGHSVDLGSKSASYVSLKNLLITGGVRDQVMSGVGDNRCINANFFTTTAGKGLYVGYCTLQQYPTLISLLNMGDMTIEYCKMWRNYAGNSGLHPNVFQVQGGTNVVFRFNEVTEYLTEGIMMDFSSANDLPNDNWDIYGNIWHNSVSGWYGRIVETQYRTQSRIRVYNNTFVNLSMGVTTANGGTWGSGCSFRNNLHFNCGGINGFGLGADDYNLSDGRSVGANSITNATSGIFVDFAGRDYRILGTIGSSFPRNKGTALGTIYSIDPLGNIRGADGAWDIGAYEYGANSTNPVIFVSPFSLDFGGVTIGTSADLSFTVKNIGGGTLTGNASVTAPFSIVSGANYNLAQNQTQVVTIRFSPSAVGTTNKTVALTGGGNASVSLDGRGVSANNQAPIVSAISQSASDVNGNLPGLQVYEGTVVQYSASASDPEGDPLSWQWLYSVNGGPEAATQSGTGPVAPASFSYGAGSAGNTYVWKLRLSDGIAVSEATLSVGVEAPPTASLSFAATNGTISSPFSITGNYISQTVNTEGLTNGGRAVYNFNITNTGNYVIQAQVNAPNDGANSFFINIDSLPQTPSMIWDILPTTGFEQRLVSWRGNGTFDQNEFSPKVFRLVAGSHQLFVVGREGGTQLQALSIRRLPSAPSNLRVIAP